MSEQIAAEVARHYAPTGLRDKVKALVAAADRETLSVDELEHLDQFHVLGKDATLRLAQRAEVDATMRVLDVGSGMGGPARLLAAEFGCRVTGVDYSEDFLQTAELFTELTGLQDRVDFQRAEATALPFDDRSFDLVWTQHAQQNIPDKERFFSELYRVLKPGGRCVMHDLMDGGGGVEPTFPAYWGRDPALSFLIGERETKDLLAKVGFEILDWQDTTPETIRWHEGLLDLQTEPHDASEASGVAGLDFGLLFGEDTVTMTENALTDMRSRAIGIFEAVLARPA